MRSVREERLRQGVKAKDLAARMGVSAARVCVLERDEARGAVTIAQLDKAAAALGCRLEYRLKPVEPSVDDKPRLRLRVSTDSHA